MTPKMTETSGTVRPSILPRLSLALSLAAFMMAGLALWVAVEPESARGVAMRFPGWAFPKRTTANAAAPKVPRKGETFGPSVDQVINDFDRRGLVSPPDVHEPAP